MVNVDCAGIDVVGDPGSISVTIYGHRRIAAARDAAARHLRDGDEAMQALDQAVARGWDSVELPELWDSHDAHVVAELLEDVRNGDDRAARRAAAELRNVHTPLDEDL